MKGLTRTQEFRPTIAMEYTAYRRAELGEKIKDGAFAKKAGIRPETFCRWKQINGFNEWFEERVAYYRMPILKRIEFFAIKNMANFNFWKAMAEKYGFISQQGDGSGSTETKARTLSEMIDLVTETRGKK